jgi:hypothetical protein
VVEGAEGADEVCEVVFAMKAESGMGEADDSRGAAYRASGVEGFPLWVFLVTFGGPIGLLDLRAVLAMDRTKRKVEGLSGLVLRVGPYPRLEENTMTHA